MVKRLFDIVLSILVILGFIPLFLLIATSIKLTSKGDIFYRAKRAGAEGKPFILFKFRTMMQDSDIQSEITGLNDSRVFFVGRILRKFKMDELPQFWNVLKGEMSIVGPRPESIAIVERHYNSDLYQSTLSVLPGIASPGSLFNYTHCHEFIDDNDPEASYVSSFLPIKLALEAVYVRNQSFLYDLSIICRTVKTILKIAVGNRDFLYPQEYSAAIKCGYIKHKL